ncbi:hypothetical protein SDC9_139287 [bioreactor metagenome]|uniref:Uncharacterized protein n=1 Tax=bioreactor metagenome TaxID=1076179 RepID=A0A645DUY1_9ZZZZ
MKQPCANLVDIGAVSRKPCHRKSAVAGDKRGDPLPHKRFKIWCGVLFCREPVVMGMCVKKAGGNAFTGKIDNLSICDREVLPDRENSVVFDQNIAFKSLRTRSVIDAAVLQQCFHLYKILPV